jgi:hypothetical protein
VPRTDDASVLHEPLSEWATHVEARVVGHPDDPGVEEPDRIVGPGNVDVDPYPRPQPLQGGNGDSGHGS